MFVDWLIKGLSFVGLMSMFTELCTKRGWFGF